MPSFDALAAWTTGLVLLASGCQGGVVLDPGDEPLDLEVFGLAVDPKTPYAIKSTASGRCFQPAGASLAPQTKIVLAPCEESNTQSFLFTWVEGRAYSIANVASGLCLDISGRQKVDGAALIQSPCEDVRDQQFAVPNSPGGTSVTFTARHSGKHLDVAADGTIVQWSRSDAGSQHFVLAARRRLDGGTPPDGGALVDGGMTDGGGSPADGGRGDGGSSPDGGKPSDAGSPLDAGPGASCSTPAIRITEVPAGTTVVANEDEASLKPLVISPMPSGGSRVAFMGSDGKAHIVTLRADDTVDPATPTVILPVNDLGDLLADDTGGVLLATRDAQGGGTLHCGNPANLCIAPSPAIPCSDMYLVRFDGASERWAAKLTNSSSALPPYSTGPTGGMVYMIWWYAHHGRIATDGTNYAAYFGSAISVSQNGCIDIAQGDRLQVVSPSGAVLSGHDSFDWGCSPSGYERIVWDARVGHFVTVCKTDDNSRITFAPSLQTTIYPVDLWYANLGDLVLARSGGYWLTTSNARAGQPAKSPGLADVHLLHFSTGQADKDLTLASDVGLNDRAPLLAAYGANHLLAAWETSPATGDLLESDTNRALYVQVLDGSTGAAVSNRIRVDAKGNRYQALRAFPDGSVAYASTGATPMTLRVVRVLPCQ